MSTRRIDLAAIALSALLHSLVALVFWNAQLFGTADTAAAQAADAAETVEVTLQPDAGSVGAPAPDAGAAAIVQTVKPLVAQPDMPTAYTDVPARMAGEKPEHADFLALDNSRAADRVPGGERDSRPAAPEESEVDQVAIQRQRDEGSAQSALPPASAGATPAPLTPPPAAAKQAAAAGAPPRGQNLPGGDDALFASGQPEQGSLGELIPGRGGDRQGRPSAPATTDQPGLQPGQPSDAPPEQDVAPDNLFGGQGLTLFRRAQEGGAGDRGFDFDQPATGRPGGNAFIYGDYALNTYAWNFAPWLQRFGQDLRRNWFAPYAYMIGVINGKTEMKVVIERDGRLGSLEVQREEGHPSLRQASEAAVRAASPFAPLPPDFPEQNLVIILTLYYPAWRTESEPARAPASGGEGGRGRRGGR